MPQTFTITNTPSLHFGCGKISTLPALTKQYGNRVLLVTGSNSFTHSEWGKTLEQRFGEAGVTTLRLSVEGEPSPNLIDEAVRQAKHFHSEVIVAIGGGSALDAGKAISAMFPVEGSVKEFLEGIGTKRHSGYKLPFIAVPTTAGTGSEATKNAVLSETGVNGFKRSLRHDKFVPDLALIDPELAISCPASITAATGMDAFTQLLESFVSTNANPFTDALALKGLELVARSLRRAVFDGKDINARTDMAFAAFLSGICLANAGLGTVHGFASTIGGAYAIPHGVICSALMYPVNLVTVRRIRQLNDGVPALRKFLTVAKLFLPDDGRNDDQLIDDFIKELRVLRDEFQIPPLSSYGLNASSVPLIASGTENKNNPVALSTDELCEALMLAL